MLIVVESVEKNTGTLATAAGLVQEIRPWQWYKQIILLLPILFSKSVFDSAAWTKTIVGIVAFCAVAGVTYIGNDISDVEEDRKHPEKRHRPIASGQVSIPVAAAFACFLLIVGLTLAYSIDLLFLIVLCGYLAQNVLYTTYLKDIVIVDVLVVALGFVLRAIAGVVAIDVYLSPWLVVCTYLAALLLVIGKRRHEMIVSDDPAETRSTLAEYTSDTLDQLLIIVISSLLVSYSLYTFFRAETTMMLTLPFAFFATFRYHHLVHTADLGGNPSFLFYDRQFLSNLVLWGIVTISVLYGLPDYLIQIIQTI